ATPGAGAPPAAAVALFVAAAGAGAAVAALGVIAGEGIVGQGDAVSSHVQAAAGGVRTIAPLGLIALYCHAAEIQRARTVDGAAFRGDACALRQTARQRQVLQSQRAAVGHV